ncbi:hypothetical protein [Phytohabitans aurantiacus]|uniref:Uncharacterized protein n=1 Tax=Phytohabitans aurantiacus TaxID=3016789 RepID=A0ABQ5RAB1_9ACTN|nr:hypothetical protein [Phytohabitans aurantiacus]GLI03699.1 hypothetical protein Pa4123_89780 [Phytohabitans aurantiacus]
MNPMPADRDLSVGDPVLGKSRLLSRQCATCIFKPGNLMHLQEGRLKDLVSETRATEGFIVCHSTLPHYPKGAELHSLQRRMREDET